MNKAVFLSSCGDPFLTMFTHKLFLGLWYNEVDRFYISINNHAEVPKEVISELLARLSFDPKVHIIYHPNGIGNGMPITEMTQIAKEDLVMLLEDDGFIFTPGKVDECFKRIESGEVDALGSPRGSCGMEIWDAMKEKYKLDYSGYGDVGPNYWPNFFFCKRKDLLATDMNFASKEFTKGVNYAELGHTMSETQYGDTFVWADIQMRHNGVRFGHIPQYHASPSEVQDKELRLLNWYDGQVPYWLHGGSLSSGWSGYLNKSIPPLELEQQKQEMESRLAFWTIACYATSGFDEFKKLYIQGIANLVNNGKLDFGHVQAKVNLYRKIMKI